MSDQKLSTVGSVIRRAVPKDLPALIALGARMHAESPHFRRVTFSPAKLEQTLKQLIESAGGFLWVGDEAGQITGVMAGIAFEHWCSTDVVVSDLALFVEPPYRGTLLAARLVKRFQAWAKDAGAKLVTVGVSTEVQVEQTARLYEMLGFRRFGVLMEN